MVKTVLYDRFEIPYRVYGRSGPCIVCINGAGQRIGRLLVDEFGQHIPDALRAKIIHQFEYRDEHHFLHFERPEIMKLYGAFFAGGIGVYSRDRSGLMQEVDIEF